MAAKKKARRYGSSVGSTVKKVMHERKTGSLRSGRSKKKVTSRRQAVAIALSEARSEGKKVPAKKSAKKASKTGKKTGKKTSKKTSKTSKKRAGRRSA